MKTMLLIIFDMAAFEIIVVNTILWIKSELIIKKHFGRNEPFRRAGFFRTPLIGKNSTLPEQFLNEWFELLKFKTTAFYIGTFSLVTSGILYTHT